MKPGEYRLWTKAELAASEERALDNLLDLAAATKDSPASYRLWVSLDRTVLVRLWANGLMEVCTRDQDRGIWGPPVELEEEKV